MKMKQKLLVTLLSMFSIFIIISAIILYSRTANSQGEYTEMGIINADTDFIMENLALYQNTIAAEDWNLVDYPYRVCILNPSDLASCGIDSFGIDYLEPFLDLYINMYEPDGVKYQGQVLVDTYIKNSSIPQFMVSLNSESGDNLMIKCSYFVQAQMYEFDSALSE